MAVTDTPLTVPNASTPANPRPTPATATPSSPAQPSAAPAATAETAPPAPAPAAIGFSLSYDAATQRLILEAREPGSGFVISQIPPSYAVRLLSASFGGVAPARGAKVNSAV